MWRDGRAAQGLSPNHREHLIASKARGGEPFGLITIEAGACRRPIVAARDGGLPEVICHGENGFLADREDLAGLVHLTTLLIADERLRQRMGQRARQIVEDHFTEQPVRALERAYERLLSRT